MEPYPTVTAATRVLEATRGLTRPGRPGLIVVDEHDHPVAVVPGSQVLKFILPGYIQDDPTLARVVTEGFSDQLCEALKEKTVGDLLPKDPPRLPLVQPDDNLVGVAALMAREHSPLVAVVDGQGKQAPMVGVIRLAQLMERLLAATA